MQNRALCKLKKGILDANLRKGEAMCPPAPRFLRPWLESIEGE